MRAPDPTVAPGDRPAFEALLERHRRELQVHCYRMLGSLEDSEDLVQETFLRAWRGRASFSGGRDGFRAWLYRIATNACLDVLRRRPRRVTPPDVGPPADPSAPIPAPEDLPWLQPYPDRLLEPVSPAEEEPAAMLVARETIELAFIAAIQHLPARQRAALILRDVLGWSARDAAALLETSVPSVTSALQRARATLRERLGDRRTEWAPATEPSARERELLRRYVTAHDETDADGLAALLREDVRLTMPPHAVWFDGRDAVMTAVRRGMDDPAFGELVTVETAANRQPAAAHYLRAPGDGEHRALVIDVLTTRDGRIAEISSFVWPGLFPAFGLPPTLGRR